MNDLTKGILFTLVLLALLALAAWGGYEFGHDAGAASVTCPAPEECPAEKLEEAVREGRSFLGTLGGILEGGGAARDSAVSGNN